VWDHEGEVSKAAATARPARCSKLQENVQERSQETAIGVTIGLASGVAIGVSIGLAIVVAIVVTDGDKGASVQGGGMGES
jgi:hypothetical protein